MKYNPKEVKERPEYEFPDEGICKVKIVDAEDAISKASGVDMIKLTVEVCENQKGAGYKTQFYIVDGEWASTNIDSVLRSCGKSANLDKVLKEVEMPTQDFIGLTGSVMLKNEEYKGLEYPKINYWIADETNGVAAEVANIMTEAVAPEKESGTKTVDGVVVNKNEEDDIPF